MARWDVLRTGLEACLIRDLADVVLHYMFPEEVVYAADQLSCPCPRDVCWPRYTALLRYIQFVLRSVVWTPLEFSVSLVSCWLDSKYVLLVRYEDFEVNEFCFKSLTFVFHMHRFHTVVLNPRHRDLEQFIRASLKSTFRTEWAELLGALMGRWPGFSASRALLRTGSYYAKREQRFLYRFDWIGWYNEAAIGKKERPFTF